MTVVQVLHLFGRQHIYSSSSWMRLVVVGFFESLNCLANYMTYAHQSRYARVQMNCSEHRNRVVDSISFRVTFGGVDIHEIAEDSQCIVSWEVGEGRGTTSE